MFQNILGEHFSYWWHCRYNTSDTRDIKLEQPEKRGRTPCPQRLGKVNPAYTRLFQCTDTRMWVNTLQCIRLERETSYDSIMRKFGWSPKHLLLIMIYMCGNLKRVGLKTSLRGSRIPEKLNIHPNRILLEGDKTGRKCSGCVWLDENSVWQ